jgi:hypothetical protein
MLGKYREEASAGRPGHEAARYWIWGKRTGLGRGSRS